MTLSVSTDTAAARIPAALWSRIAGAPMRLLALDYDGTLVAFQTDPMDARPAARTRDALLRVAETPGTTLAILSGRPLRELAVHVGDLGCRLIGEHGWSERSREGAEVHHPLPSLAVEGLSHAEARAVRAGASLRSREAPRLERKRTGLVLHLRGLEEAAARAWRARIAAEWADVAAAAPLRIDTTNGGLEIRASERDKGSAIDALLREIGEEALAVAIGDDATDEDAFRAVAGRGFGILVSPVARLTSAAVRFPDCDAVTRLIEMWPLGTSGASRRWDGTEKPSSDVSAS